LERPLAIVHHPALKEIDLPQWAGLKYREVQETWPAAYQCWMDHPEQFEMMPTQTPGEGIGPAGKPVPDLYAQAQHFWQEVLPQHQGQTIVVVSHGGTIRALVSTALGIPCPYYHTLQQSNCGITTLTFDAAQQAQLEVLNDTSHLGEVLPKLKAGRQGLRLLMVPTSDTSFETLKALQASLEPVNLAFSVSNGKAAQALTQSLLTGHPGAVQLQVDRPDLSQLWLHTLNQRQYPQAADPEIMTGLLVAPAPMLQQMLCHIIGTESTRQDCLPLAAGRVSIVHFPTRQRTPVLQAVNFAGSTPAIGELRSCAS
jgi:probable phosphoglycerate mutase